MSLSQSYVQAEIIATTTFRGLSVNKITRLTLAVAVSMCASVALAQSTNSGDIRGTVTDKTGAVVPGATVSVEDIDKNVTKTFTTNGGGLYDTGSIVPDHYIITFSKTGFSTVVRGPVTVEVGQLGVNAELAVGATTQRVVVNTNVPLLKTETGDQSSTFTSNDLEQLPQVSGTQGNTAINPSWMSFTDLLPGAASGPNGASPGIVTSVNGNLPYSDVLSDGATATLPQSQNTAVGGYILESVGELKVETSSFSAQYGVGGVIYNQIGKGGTDQFHGELYGYLQDDTMNAAPYRFGVPVTAADPKVPVLTYRDWGFNVGGPVLRKRAFFFFDYDHMSQAGGAATNENQVPTASELGGDFTGEATVYDPATSALVTGADGKQYVQRTSFLTETGKNAIPTARQDPTSLAFEKFYPAPNNPTDPTHNLVFNLATPTHDIRYYGRADVDITPKNRLTVTDFESNETYTPHYAPTPCPIDCQNADIEDQNAEISDVWTITPKFLNEARMGFLDQLNFFVPESLNKGYTKAAAPGIDLLSAKADVLPVVGIDTSAGTFLNLEAQWSDINAVYKEFAYDPSDVVTLIKGKHVLHFGGEFLMNQANSTAWGNIQSGVFHFNGSYTQSYDSTTSTPTNIVTDAGNPYADFLLGNADSWGANNTPEHGGRLKLPQAFVQDDIQVRPNLTVNIGLRWQGMTGWTEVKGNELSFDPTLANPANSNPGDVWNGVTKLGGRTRLMAPVWSTFLPRAGFSWQPTTNLVVRGGGGLYAYTWSTDTYANGLGNLFGSSGGEGDQTGGFSPVDVFGDNGSINYQCDSAQAASGYGSTGCPTGAATKGTSINTQYLTAATAPGSHNGTGVSYQQYHTPVPKIWQYNVQVQRELGNNLVAELGYVGSHAFNLVYVTDLNQIPVSKLSINDANTSRPYPNFTSITGTINSGVSTYNSVQAEVTKRMSDGLSFDVSYVLSSFKDDMDSSGWGGRAGAQPYQLNTPSSNYGPSNFDTRNALKGQVVYELPIGKGRRFLNNNAIVDAVIGGWQTSSTLVWTSGHPYTLTIGGANNSYLQAGSWYPNVVGHASNPKTLTEWYNPLNYATPTPGTIGNSTRNSQVGPGYSDLSLAVAKTFPIWKTVAAYIAASADNVLNHPSFAQPDGNVDAGVVNGVLQPNHAAGDITGTVNGNRTMMLTGKILF